VNSRKVICLVIDRLRADMLGPYGNTWVSTPTLNHLAANGFLADQFLIDTADLSELCRSLWEGSHRLERMQGSFAARESLITRANHAGHSPMLLTDDADVATHPLAAAFNQRVVLPTPDVEELAEEVEETRLASFFAGALDALAANEDSNLVWLHAGSLGSAWDAPYSYREKLADEEDPEPPCLVIPPSYTTATDVDPDELLGITQAYAGQVMLLDELLGGFCAGMRELPAWQNAALLILGARGFPLGEHRRVGDHDPLPYSELVHVPCLLQLPDQQNLVQRTSALVQPPEITATIAGLLGLTPDSLGLLPLLTASSAAAAQRDRAIIAHHSDDLVFRTPAWQLRLSKIDREWQSELFVKPDDRYEVSNVARKMPHVTEAMTEQLLAAHASGNLDLQSPLPEITTHGV
jgi:hypothetical protein